MEGQIEERRAGRRGRRRRSGHGDIEARRQQGPAQPAYRQVKFRYRPIEPLFEDQIEAIHNASMTILETVGLRVLDDEARRVYREGGAEVDESTQTVRLDRAMVAEKIALVPSEFLLEARNPARSVRLGRQNLVFSAVGGPAFVQDLDNGRRRGSYEDLCNYLKLIQSLNILHQEGGSPFEVLDLPGTTRHLDLHHAQITLLDKNWQPWGLGRVRARDGLEMMAIALGCTREDLAGRVVFTCIINTNSPLTLDIPMAEGLMEMAAHGQAVVVTPFTLSGAMAPVTLAGALAQQNAEALAGIVLTQCVRPGVPALYGSFTTNVDMKTGSPAFGTPEYTLAAQISGQLARRYDLPWRSSNVTAANDCDAQAAYESEMSLWGAVMGGAHMINHAAGWLGGGLTASFEKLILDAEMLQMMAHYLEPPQIDAASLAVDAIRGVGSGGHFFGEPHTLERYETAFYAPLVSDWSNFDAWQEKGSPTAVQHANRVWKRLLADYERPPLDAAVEEALAAYVQRRKKEIDQGIGVPTN